MLNGRICVNLTLWYVLPKKIRVSLQVYEFLSDILILGYLTIMFQLSTFVSETEHKLSAGKDLELLTLAIL
jgi:hypothetical protein